jgi:hypothetical protein
MRGTSRAVGRRTLGPGGNQPGGGLALLGRSAMRLPWRRCPNPVPRDRRIAGWRASRSLRSALALDALEQASPTCDNPCRTAKGGGSFVV